MREILATALGSISLVVPIGTALFWTANVYGESLENATDHRLLYKPLHLQLSGIATPSSLECKAIDIDNNQRQYTCSYGFKEFDPKATTTFDYDPLLLKKEQSFHQTFLAASAVSNKCTVYALPKSDREMTLIRLECF